MQRYEFKDLLEMGIPLKGALDFDQRPGGLSPRRLADWTRPQVPQAMDVIVRMPSGVRLIFETDAEMISISALGTNLVIPPATRKPIVFDLEVGDQIFSQPSDAGNAIQLNPEDRTDFTLIRGNPDEWHFQNLPPGNKHCELWLPQNAFVELHALSINDGAIIKAPVKSEKPQWVHYGSSISHCMEADQPALIWPAVAARITGMELHNLGFGGQCHLDQFVARTIRDSDADYISLKVGINVINGDSMRERVFTSALHGFLDTIREGKPDTPITLISPIFCPSAEDQPGPTIPDRHGKFVTLPGHDEIREGCMSLSRTRTLIEEVVSRRADQKLDYLNGLSLFGAEEAGDLPDDLHPNPAGYIRMGERFAAHLAKR